MIYTDYLSALERVCRQNQRTLDPLAVREVEPFFKRLIDRTSAELRRMEMSYPVTVDVLQIVVLLILLVVVGLVWLAYR